MIKKNKAIYILGGSSLGLNIVKWAKEIGLKTIVTDKDSQALGLEIADESSILDTAYVDKHLKYTDKLSKKYEIVGVYCGNEIGLKTVQAISKRLGIEHLSDEALENVQDKVKMKKIWKEKSLASPITQIVRNPEEIERFVVSKASDFVIKPARGSGSRGVQIVKKSSNYNEVFNNTLDSVDGIGKVILEEFIEGRSIDVNGLFIEDIFYPAGILEKYTTEFPDCLPLGGNDPADISEKERKEVYSLFEKGCRLLGINYGPVKGDLIRSAEGYQLLEVAPRMHGDVTTCNTLPYGFGINPMKFYFKYLKDGFLNMQLIKPSNNKYATWRVICLPPGKIKSIKLKEEDYSEKKQISKVWLNNKIVDKIEKYTDTRKIPGYICAFGSNKKDAETALEDFFINMKCEIEINQTHINWYKSLGRKLESYGFNKKSCGYLEVD